MTKEGSTRIVNFMTSGVGVVVLRRGHKSHIVNICLVLLHNLLLYSRTWIIQTKNTVMMTKEVKEPLWSWTCRSMIAWQFYGCLTAIDRIKRLSIAQSWTIFNRTPHSTSSVLSFYNCLARFMIFAISSATWLRLTTVRKSCDKNRTSDVNWFMIYQSWRFYIHRCHIKFPRLINHDINLIKIH